jgi:hypothetical protein
MTYPTTLIVAALVCSMAAAAPEPVTCDSPCDSHNAHGEGRWSVKSDASLPPKNGSAIQAEAARTTGEALELDASVDTGRDAVAAVASQMNLYRCDY